MKHAIALPLYTKKAELIIMTALSEAESYYWRMKTGTRARVTPSGWDLIERRMTHKDDGQLVVTYCGSRSLSPRLDTTTILAKLIKKHCFVSGPFAIVDMSKVSKKQRPLTDTTVLTLKCGEVKIHANELFCLYDFLTGIPAGDLLKTYGPDTYESVIGHPWNQFVSSRRTIIREAYEKKLAALQAQKEELEKQAEQVAEQIRKIAEEMDEALGVVVRKV